MADRWRTGLGWSVEVVTVRLTPDSHDGTWLRVRYLGYWVADVRQADELARWFPIAELAEALTSRLTSQRAPPPGRASAASTFYRICVLISGWPCRDLTGGNTRISATAAMNGPRSRDRRLCITGH